MRLLLIILSVSLNLYGASKSGQIDASSDNVPTAFDNADAGSKMFECGHGQHVMIHNETDDRIAWGIGLTATDPSSEHGYVIPNNTVAKDGITISSGNFIYIRSDSGAPITVGTISAECW